MGDGRSFQSHAEQLKSAVRHCHNFRKHNAQEPSSYTYQEGKKTQVLVKLEQYRLVRAARNVCGAHNNSQIFRHFLLTQRAALETSLDEEWDSS